MDLKESFDRALDGGPAHRPVEDRLILGRRATRRRRTASGAAAIASVVVVVGGVGWAGMSFPSSTGGGPVASGDSTSAPASSERPVTTVRDPLYGYDYFTGDLTPLPGVAVQREVDQPVDRPGVRSSAAIVTYEGETWWVMSAALHEGSAGWNEEHEATGNRTFEQWMHEMDVLNTEPMFDTYGYEAGWVTIAKNGVLTAHKGAKILEQSSPARPDQAPADVPSATATIEVDGARLCVIARIHDDPSPNIIYLAESEYPGCGDAVIGYPYESAP